MEKWEDIFGVNLLTCAIVSLAIVILYQKWVYSYWRRKGVQSFPTKVIFGNAKDLVLRRKGIGDEFLDVHNELKSKDLKYGGYYFLNRPVFVVRDVKLIKQILQVDFDHFTNHSSWFDEEMEPVRGHLFHLKHDRWKHMRGKLNPVFSSGKVKAMLDIMLAHAEELKTILDQIADNGNSFDCKEIVSRYTMDIIGSCAFGVDLNIKKDQNSQVFKQFSRITQPGGLQTIKVIANILYPELFKRVKICVLEKEISQFLIKIVKEVIQYRKENNVTRTDFLQLLTQLKQQKRTANDKGVDKVEDVPLTIEQMAAQSLAIFVGGFETSSIASTFCLLEFVLNPEIQEKARKEVVEIMKKNGGQITYEGLQELKYLEQCVYESMRKHPPFAVLNRECTKTYTIPNSKVVIDEGSLIMVSIWGIHKDPHYYPEPEKFDPERFSEENKLKRDSYAFLPMGKGPRICIGIRFGLVQVKLLLATLLSRYSFYLSDKTKLPIEYDPAGISLSVKGGVWLNVSKLR